MYLNPWAIRLSTTKKKRFTILIFLKTCKYFIKSSSLMFKIQMLFQNSVFFFEKNRSLLFLQPKNALTIFFNV